MTESRIETVNYSATSAEHCSSPVTFDCSNNDEVFHMTRSLSGSAINLSQEQCNNNLYSSVANGANNNAIAHMQAYQRSLSSNALDQIDHQTLATDINQYPINQDPNPELIQRHNNERITYKQDVAIRYLQPPTPPPPGPVIIREIRAPQAPDAPPLVIKQRPPVPPTPPPIVIRERPPMPPPIEPPRIVNKYLPAPPPPPRKVIIERQAPLPQKPQPVIIEKWLPYQPPPERRVVLERAEPIVPRPSQKNTIITYDAPHVNLVKNIHNLGVTRADPHVYDAQYGSQLASNQYVLNMMHKFGLGNNYAQMYQMQTMNNNLNAQQSLAYQQSSASNMYSSQSRSHCNTSGNLVGLPILPNGYPVGPPILPNGCPIGPPILPNGYPVGPPILPNGYPVGPPILPNGCPVGSPILSSRNRNRRSSTSSFHEQEIVRQEMMIN